MLELIRKTLCGALCIETHCLGKQALLASGNTSVEVAELLKLICKTFWSASYMEIPAQLAEPAQFGGWMTALHSFVLQPVPAVS